MDFAAWMEVWLGERWWTFDPRNNMRRKGRVVIGRGRDASDVAMATTFGGPDAGIDGGSGRGGAGMTLDPQHNSGPGYLIIAGWTWTPPGG